MKIKSVINESEQIQLAIKLINFGARLQLLESETTLSRERLIKLYKELRHESPPKGMLPFSTDWFLSSLYNFIRRSRDSVVSDSSSCNLAPKLISLMAN